MNLTESQITMDSPVITAALYGRVSTDEQVLKFSLGSQVELLRKHVADNKYRVFDEYIDDGYTGTNYDRPQFQRLMEDAKQGKFQIVLVYRVDRFFRSNKDLLTIVDELQKLGVNFRSITEPFDTSTYLGKFILSLFGSIAELERNTFMERSRLGRMRRAKEGYYSGSSPSKFGYIYNKETKKIERDEKEVEPVKIVFDFYNQPDSSILKVTRKMRQMGYKTKEGYPMREDVVHDILRDPIYIGRWFANKHDSRTGKLKPVKEWIEVKVPAIVSEEVFNKAQEYLAIRKNYSTRNSKYQYLLQGMVKCGDCGNTVAGTADKQFQTKNGKQYGPYFKLYYRCTHFVKNKFEKLVKCKLRYVQALRLEDAVWNKVEKIFTDPDMIKYSVNNGGEIKKTDKEDISKEIARISLVQEGLDKEEHRVLEAYRQSIISIDQLKEQLNSVTKSREDLGKTKQELTASLDEKSKNAEIEEAIDYIKRVKEGLKKFDYQTKKQALQLLKTSVKVNINGILDIDCQVPRLPSVSDEEFLSHFALPSCISWS